MLLLPSLMRSGSAELGQNCRAYFYSRISLRLSPASPGRAPVRTLMSPCEMCPGWQRGHECQRVWVTGPWAGLHRDDIPADLCQLALPHRGENPLWVQDGLCAPGPQRSPGAPSPSCLVRLPKTLGISSSRRGEAGGALAMSADVDLLCLSSRN